MSTVYKKNGKWYCRPTINGESPHRLCKGCNDKKSAEMFEAALIVRIEKQQNGIIP